VKPDNVLIFKHGDSYHAKIADFGHSLLNSGETRLLIGGSELFAAPEWKQTATTDFLMLTDVYSYGLVFAELALGFAIHRHLQNTGKLHEFAARKLEDNFNEYVENMLFQADRTGLRGGDWDNPELITDVLNATLQKDANKRNLHDVILILSLM
jgi:serine/threonine protein kinase